MESDQNFAINLAYACAKVRSLKSRVSRTAFVRVSPNESTESATELISLAYLRSLRSHVFQQATLKFLSEENSCLNTMDSTWTSRHGPPTWTPRHGPPDMDLPTWTPRNGPPGMDTQNGPGMDPHVDTRKARFGLDTRTSEVHPNFEHASEARVNE